MPLLFLVVFINLLGFGVIIPLLPFYVLHLGAGPELIALVFSIYSGVQFLTAPIWGRLSDKFGRRPILVWTLVGTIASYVMLAYADTFSMLVASRFLGGVMAGNLGTVYAYVTDITTEENRSKGMGLMGAAFGLGFIFGPAIGGVLAGADAATANYFLPAIVAAGLSALACIGVITILPESLTEEARRRFASQPSRSLLAQLETVLSRPSVAMLVLIGFVFIAAWAGLEATFGFWAQAEFGFGPEPVGWLLAGTGVVGVIVQGAMIGPLTRWFGEEALLGTSMLLSIVGFLGLAASSSLRETIVSMSVLAVASGLFTPSATSLVSKEASEAERGVILGVYQGAGSLSRVVGPAAAGPIFVAVHRSAPFVLAAVLMVPCLFILKFVVQRRKASASPHP